MVLTKEKVINDIFIKVNYTIIVIELLQILYILIHDKNFKPDKSYPIYFFSIYNI